MRTLGLVRTWRVLALAGVLSISAAPLVAQPQSENFEGRRLVEALKALQVGGLRIVFSSEIVTASMRVASEPRAKNAREKLDELLEPHGLKAERGPGGVIQVVPAKRIRTSEPRKRPADKKPGRASRENVDPPRSTTSYSERVTVTAPLERHNPGVGAEVTLGSDELQDLQGVLADDPLRAVQALPRVATGDDFRSEFSVRGSPYRHVGVVVDGVATPWLQHAAYGRGDTGSVAMLNSAALEEATLLAGAYPQRYGDRLGAQLGLTLRQGSRTDTRFRGALSGTNATLLGEGPIGRSERGSWLVTLRNSYIDWPLRKLGRQAGGTVFGFTDAQATLVYDVRRNQQLTFSVLGGKSNVDERDNRGPNPLADGTNGAAVLNLAWRSTFGSGLVFSQRAYLVSHQFLNRSPGGQVAGGGTDGELSYRADVARTMLGGVLEAGAQGQRMHGARHFAAISEPASDAMPPLQWDNGFEGSSWLRSGYVHFTWSPSPRFTIAPGLRIADSTLGRERAIGRWILGEWHMRSGWTLNASAGVSHQFPEFEQVLGGDGAPGLRPERATHVDIGIEQRLAKTVRWQATIFNRAERDILREPDTSPRLLDGIITESSVGRYENALSGSARGVELMLERRSATGLSGWVAYSYGKTRYADATRNETFWADFDQRHAINAAGVYRLSDRTMFAVKFRGGSNFPIPGYLVAKDGGLFVGGERNDVRLPPYARLDVRVNRSFTYAGRRFTLFAEVLNVLDRTNLGLANGTVRRGTREVAGFTEALFSRLPSAGLLIEF